jgi:hypothetical protein
MPFHSDDVIHIPLPEMSRDRATRLQEQLNDFLQGAHVRTRGTRLAADENIFMHVLGVLWKAVVKPVYEALGFRHPTVS